MILDEERIGFIYENINAIFPLNIIVSNYKTNTIKRFSTIEFPELIKEEEKDIIQKIISKLSVKGMETVYQVESGKRLMYMGFGIYDNNGYEGTVIVGPYLKELGSNILGCSGEKMLYEGITLINKSQEKAIANIIATIINTNKVTNVSLEGEKAIGVGGLNYTFDDYEVNLSWINEMYRTERSLLHYVSQGNKEQALEFMKDANERISEINRFPENPIRNVKNLAITLNMLLRKAAERSSVDVYFIHTTSENLAVRIENSLTIRGLTTLMTDMVSEYCNLINEHNTISYSDLVSKAITYVKLNFRRDISLSSIAKELFIHPTYLAKKFKIETGKTISEYVNEVRIKEAQFMIKATEFKIEDIGDYVGYNDKKYFSKTFKKVVGVSPSEYRKYNNGEE